MSSELRQSVRTAIQNFVTSKTCDGDHVPIDVLRIVAEEATLAMERQVICDTFDADPLKFYDGDDMLMIQVNRLKKVMNVLSCDRCSTGDGYSSIDAVVELRKDAMFQNVQESVRLSFHFRRRKLKQMEMEMVLPETETAHSDKGDVDVRPKATRSRDNDNPTQITYTIDYSKDHGEKKRLAVVEVFAKTDHPSVKEAIPICMQEEEEDDDMDMDMSQEKSLRQDAESENNNDDDDVVDDDDNKNDDNERDRYQAYADPCHVEEFLHHVGLELNAENALFFLMTFPFYEHEWDIFGFLLDCVFGDDDDDDDGEDDSDDEYEDMSDNEEG